MFGRLKCMLVKEFLQMLRDVRMRIVVFGLPVVQMVVFAFALNTDVTRIRTGVLDMDGTPASREVIERFTSSGYFRVEAVARDEADMRRLLVAGRVQVVLRFPIGFQGDMSRGRTARMQLIADGTDSNTTAIIMGYANQIVAAYTKEKLGLRMAALTGKTPGGEVRVQTRAWYNPNLESRFYYVPALIAVMLVVFGMVLTSIGIVREKEIGTIEQVMVTPIRRFEFILGKTVPYVITSYITMTIMLLTAMAVFEIRVQGSWLLLYGLSGLFILCNLGLALLISVSAQTQQQALLTAFLVMMPAVLLSGFMFPVKNMPLPVQYATYANPVRWYLEILRGVLQKGVGMEALWPPTLALGIIAAVFTVAATVRFRKTMS
jgi:ABC-2 type transport system permease protein